MDTDDRVTNWCFLGLAWSIVSFILDVGLDKSLMINYLITDKLLFFILTLLILLVNWLVNFAFSFHMYKRDKEKNEMYPGAFTYSDNIRNVYIASALSPLWRYVQAFRFAWRSRQAENNNDSANQMMFYRWTTQEASDVALLRVFECFLEAAPQLTLQIAIAFHNHFDEFAQSSTVTVILRWICIVTSFASMAWCMASYQRTLRTFYPDKKNLTIVATLFHFLWHICVTVSRILCISLMVSYTWKWTIAVLVIHSVSMGVWLASSKNQENIFWEDLTWGSFLFYSVFGCIHIFTRVELNGGTTWRKYIIFYSVFAIETIAAVILLLNSENVYSQDLYFRPTIYAIIWLFVAGLMFMIIYYTLFHPTIGICYNDSGPVHKKYQAVVQILSRYFNNTDDNVIKNDS